MLIQQIAIGTPALFGRHPADIAAYLHDHDLTITIWPDGTTVDRPSTNREIPRQRTATTPTRLTRKDESVGVNVSGTREIFTR
jgi:hypothetical protein